MSFVRKICGPWYFSQGPGCQLTGLGFGLVWFYVGLGLLFLPPCHSVCGKAAACRARGRRCRWNRRRKLRLARFSLSSPTSSLWALGVRRWGPGRPDDSVRLRKEREGRGFGGPLPVICSGRRFPDVDGSGERRPRVFGRQEPALAAGTGRKGAPCRGRGRCRRSPPVGKNCFPVPFEVSVRVSALLGILGGLPVPSLWEAESSGRQRGPQGRLPVSSSLATPAPSVARAAPRCRPLAVGHLALAVLPRGPSASRPLTRRLLPASPLDWPRLASRSVTGVCAVRVVTAPASRTAAVRGRRTRWCLARRRTRSRPSVRRNCRHRLRGRATDAWFPRSRAAVPKGGRRSRPRFSS